MDLIRETAAGRPAWRHQRSGVVFRLVPAGTFRMGFSDEELAAIDAIIDEEGLEWDDEYAERSRPAHAVSVEAFLLARNPLTIAQARHFLPEYDRAGDDQDQHAAAMMDSLETLDNVLAVLPFRLPSEAEWEYAARAGTTTLTYRGDSPPDEDRDLLRVFGDEAAIRAHENPFGLAAMGSIGEVCADTYRDDYTDASGDARPYLGDGPRVSRGGAADLSPWQGCGEEALMFSASRAALQPDFLDMIFTGIRPALDWPFADPVKPGSHEATSAPRDHETPSSAL